MLYIASMCVHGCVCVFALARTSALGVWQKTANRRGNCDPLALPHRIHFKWKRVAQSN